MMMNAGVSFAGLTRDQLIDTQAELCRVQLALEDSMLRVAERRVNPAIILSDRGAMDGSAYMEPSMWAEMLKRNRWTTRSLREGRYDAVAHLVTTAIGAEQFYGNANNRVRSETPEQAAEIDLKLQQAWLGHPHVAFFENTTNFQGKLQRLLEWVSTVVGLPVPDDKVKRFLISKLPDWIPVPHHDFYLVKQYLSPAPGSSEQTHRRIEARTSIVPGSRPVFRYKEVLYNEQREDYHRFINIRRISKSEFEAYALLAKPEHRVKQLVQNFVFKEQYFSLVKTLEPSWLKLDYLSVTTTKEHHEINFPPWLSVGKDVTNNRDFTSHYRINKQVKEVPETQ